MKSKHGILLFVTAALAISLVACAPTRAASEAPTEVPADAFPTPENTPELLYEMAGTETAIAAATAGTPFAELPTVDPNATLDPNMVVPTLDTTGGGTGENPAVDTPEPGTQGGEQPVEPQPTVVVERPGNYTLQSGEFPYCIARRFNVNPSELLSLNGLSNGNLFQVGLVLKIPATGNPFPDARALRAHPAQYKVLSGDTIYGIACLFGDVDPRNIAAVNGLEAPFTVKPGQVLQIP